MVMEATIAPVSAVANKERRRRRNVASVASIESIGSGRVARGGAVRLQVAVHGKAVDTG